MKSAIPVYRKKDYKKPNIWKESGGDGKRQRKRDFGRREQ
jgi:hypothetical protein